jgi:uncharacterized membrane protein YphA (DoxX/SURF4 family)
MLHAGVITIAFVAGGPFDASWRLLNATGGSPIPGLLARVGTPWLLELTTVVLPLGETLIGVGLLAGGLVRLAAFFGGVLMTSFHLGNAAEPRVRERRPDEAAAVRHGRRPRRRLGPRTRRAATADRHR